ncbi:MAG: helix-turn-helix transcriptional regulator [Lachnospiraceae bacterium]|nr:helix-turn-helix transcriptional regulator [Lachnospiraceae bacterium]
MEYIQKRKARKLNRKEFGRRLRLARKRANISSNQLGNERCQVDPAYIRQIESGLKLPSIPILIRICNSLQISPSYLLENELKIENKYTNWDELAAKILQISPVFRQIIYDILQSLIENLAERKPKKENVLKENEIRIQKEFGRRLSKVREEMQFSPQQLAINCGITVAFIHQIETGIKLPSLSTFTNLCNELQISPSYLLGNELETIDYPYNEKELQQILYHMTPKAQKITIDIIRILIQNLAELTVL